MTLAQQDSYLLNYVTHLLGLSPSTEGLYFYSFDKKETDTSPVPIPISLHIE